MTRRCPDGQCLSLWSSQLTDPLVTDHLLYFSQPRPAVANYSEIPLRSDKIIYMQSKLKTLSPIMADLQIKVTRTLPSPQGGGGGGEGTAARRVRLSMEHCQRFFINATPKSVFIEFFFRFFRLYDSSRLPTVCRAADNIPRARFPTPRALLERYLQFFFFFFCRFYRVSLAKDSRLCKKQ